MLAPAAGAAKAKATSRIVVERVAPVARSYPPLNVVAVRLRCAGPAGAVCDLRIRAHRPAQKDAAERQVRLPASRARVVYVGLQQAIPDRHPWSVRRCSGVERASCGYVTVSGTAGGRALAPVSRKVDGRYTVGDPAFPSGGIHLVAPAVPLPAILYPNPFLAVQAESAGRRLDLVYRGPRCANRVVARVVSQGSGGIVVAGELVRQPDGPDGPWVCAASITRECVSVALSGPVGRRTVWVRLSDGLLVSPADLATSFSWGVLAPETPCPRADPS